MKWYKSLFVSVVSMIFLFVAVQLFYPGIEVSAASNPYPNTQDVDKDGYYEIPCTRFAWQQAYDKKGIALPSWGNAVNWWQGAKNSGYATGSSPRANSIAVWSGDYYGHVAYVTSGSGNTFTVNEGGRTDKDNTDSHGVVYGYTITNAVGASRPYDPNKVLLGFIYLDSSPSVSVSWSGYNKQEIKEGKVVLAKKASLSGADMNNVSTVGIDVYNSSDKLVKSKEEVPDRSGNTYVYIWYDLNSELGLSIAPGTVYRYSFWVKINGKKYESSKETVTCPPVYTVKFDSQGGSSVSNVTVGKNQTISKIPSSTRSGYIFEGWYTATSGGTKLDTSTKITGNITYYARWKNNTFKITLNPVSNGSASLSKTTAGEGEEITITAKPAAGYKLEYIKVNGSTINSNKFKMPAKNTNVEVVFKKDGLSGKCGDNISWSWDEKGTLTISGSGSMYDMYPSPWNNYKDDIKTITFKGNITKIGDYAFYKCSRISNVTIPSSVKYLGNYSFADCTSLSDLNLPYGLTSIGEAAIAGCTGISKISVPSSVVTLKNYAFYGCTNLRSFVIPQSVTSIGYAAFCKCSKLESVSGGTNVTTIDSWAFGSCPKLKSFKIKSSKLKKIGAYAFCNDKRLKTIYFNKTTKLTKAGVKNSLYGSSVKTVKVKKSKVKKYKKYFTKKNVGRKVKVKK